eukprot:TRINITY_DN749_c0_g1_i3.p1 TRINITY_DN749_c0_g1~~TRINITY_DN749_c0_g1_i3.p1  ORF type:complete len:163 (+),score=33.14 TRINITY_DN749_c0_g1_i3:55-543(+)
MEAPLGGQLSNGWMSDFTDNAFLDMVESQGGGPPLLWCNVQETSERQHCSAGATTAGDHLEEDCCDKDANGRRKRARDEAGECKAVREKKRRDKLNERYAELSQELDPSRPPATDKGNILSDAVRVLAQLRAEAGQLTGSIEQLREQIKELKVCWTERGKSV